MPTTRLRLGILVPSSNTALEPLTQTLITSLNASSTTHHITVHFSRFAVTQISLSPSGLAQFELAPIIAAAQLLAHANVDLIGWSGTSSGWLGFARDEMLCREIERATGVKAMTSVLALNKALELWNVKSLGLVTPYLDDVQAAIVENYQGIGLRILERHLGIQKNGDIADVSEEVLDGMMEKVCTDKEGKVEAVTTFCTNLVAAQRVRVWEAKYNVPVFDTVTTVVWEMVRAFGVDTAGVVEEWGLIFSK